MKATLGIDIAKRKHHVALIYQEATRRKVITNIESGFEELVRWLEKQQAKLGFLELHICMEATGPYYEPLAEYLSQHGYTVSVVNPARIAAFAKSKLARGKTDSALIAQFCLEQKPEPWQPLPPEIKHLQALTRHLEGLKQTRVDQQNRLKTASQNPVRQSLETLITAIDEQIKHTENRIREHLDEHPHLKHSHRLLCSIPGIAFLTAACLLAEVPPQIWATSARKLAAFAGLSPKPFESGDHVRQITRLCKTGNARLRKALFLPALCARANNPILSAFADRLIARGKNKKLVIGAIMRKLLHLAFGVLKNDQPFDPQWINISVTNA